MCAALMHEQKQQVRHVQAKLTRRCRRGPPPPAVLLYRLARSSDGWLILACANYNNTSRCSERRSASALVPLSPPATACRLRPAAACATGASRGVA